MKKNIFLVLLLIIELLLMIGCSDSAKKVALSENQMRVEYSACTGCLSCINDFDCPQNAFTIDERTGTVYIDADKCTNCMECVEEFQCPEGAITFAQDRIKPAKITDLQATSDEIGVLDITFTAVGDDSLTGSAFRYEIELTDTLNNDVATNFVPPLPSPAGTTENFVIAGLPQNATINVHLNVFDEMGFAPESVLASAIIQGEFVDNIPPAVITDLTAISGEENITLRWTATGDDGNIGSAMSYKIKYANNSINENNWETSQTLPNNITPASAGISEEFEVTALDIQSEYYFAIKAVDNEDLSSPVSNSVSATILGDQTPPAAITDAEFISSGVNSLVLRWTAVGDNATVGTATSYAIKYSTEEINETNWNSATEFPNTISPLEAGEIEQIQIDGLQAETTYFAAIKAFDEVQNSSPLSNVAIGNTEAIPDNTPPDAIDDLSAQATYTEIILNWTATGDDADEGTAFQYILKRNTELITDENWDSSETVEGLSAPQSAGNNETFTVTDCQPNITYYFALKAVDENNNYSPKSNVVNAMLIEEVDNTPPATIDLSVYEGQASNLSTIKIRWTAPGDDGDEGIVSSYEVRYATTPITEENWNSATGVLVQPTPEPAGTQQIFSVVGLEKAVIYYFAIKATDNAGNVSEISNSPSGKIIYQILINQCHDCNRCINDCPVGAISDAGSYKIIDVDLCEACGACVNECPWNLIRKWVVAY